MRYSSWRALAGCGFNRCVPVASRRKFAPREPSTFLRSSIRVLDVQYSNQSTTSPDSDVINNPLEAFSSRLYRKYYACVLLYSILYTSFFLCLPVRCFGGGGISTVCHRSESGGGRSSAICRLERDESGLCGAECGAPGTKTEGERGDKGFVGCAGTSPSIASFPIELVIEL